MHLIHNTQLRVVMLVVAIATHELALLQLNLESSPIEASQQVRNVRFFTLFLVMKIQSCKVSIVTAYAAPTPKQSDGPGFHGASSIVTPIDATARRTCASCTWNTARISERNARQAVVAMAEVPSNSVDNNAGQKNVLALNAKASLEHSKGLALQAALSRRIYGFQDTVDLYLPWNGFTAFRALARHPFTLQEGPTNDHS